jgi:hypothetical protein
VLNGPAKLTFGIAAIAAATCLGTSSGRAGGDAPWCAVISIGQGSVYGTANTRHSRRATIWVTYSPVIAAFAI